MCKYSFVYDVVNHGFNFNTYHTVDCPWLCVCVVHKTYQFNCNDNCSNMNWDTFWTTSQRSVYGWNSAELCTLVIVDSKLSHFSWTVVCMLTISNCYATCMISDGLQTRDVRKILFGFGFYKTKPSENLTSIQTVFWLKLHAICHSNKKWINVTLLALNVQIKNVLTRPKQSLAYRF